MASDAEDFLGQGQAGTVPGQGGGDGGFFSRLGNAKLQSLAIQLGPVSAMFQQKNNGFEDIINALLKDITGGEEDGEMPANPETTTDPGTNPGTAFDFGAGMFGKSMFGADGAGLAGNPGRSNQGSLLDRFRQDLPAGFGL